MKSQIFFVLKFAKNSVEFAFFLFQIVFQGNYRNSIKKKNLGKVAVLANGPSLKNELANLDSSEEFNHSDFIVINFFAFENAFFRIKPKHYCLADPMFFHNSFKEKDVLKLYSLLEEKVDWNIALYIPNNEYTSFINYAGLNNRYIKVIKMNTLQYTGYESFRNFYYQKGLATPRIQTVANLAIFVALNCGYSTINLYGVDHSFLHSLIVNQNNILCNKIEHFNDTSAPLLEPLVRTDNNSHWVISDYLEAIAGMFKSHDLLSRYAKYLEVQVINRTTNSMIDSYSRARLEK